MHCSACYDAAPELSCFALIQLLTCFCSHALLSTHAEAAHKFQTSSEILAVLTEMPLISFSDITCDVIDNPGSTEDCYWRKRADPVRSVSHAEKFMVKIVCMLVVQDCCLLSTLHSRQNRIRNFPLPLTRERQHSH